MIKQDSVVSDVQLAISPSAETREDAIVFALRLALCLGLSLCVLVFVLPAHLLERQLHVDGARFAIAALVLLTYVLFFSLIYRTHIAKHQTEHLVSTNLNAVENREMTWVVYASQTGYAEQLAHQTTQTLTQSGMLVKLCNITQFDERQLQEAKRIIFVVSTTGEGDAPDSAAKFVRMLMNEQRDLAQLEFAVLALGDRNYHAFCAFAHRLENCLSRQNARPLFDLVEVDNGDEGALRHWQHHLGVLSGHTDVADWSPAQYQAWTLSERVLLNPGSLGNPAFRIRLLPAEKLDWQAGDIAEILPQLQDRSAPAQNLPHREYSIASIPEDGCIELIVRQMRQADGSLGLGSGWLTVYAQTGDLIDLRVRQNRSFHGPRANIPLILIGNGTGIAGLRAHIKERASLGQHENCLFFGERQRNYDFFQQAEIENWLTTGVLQKCDFAFSRDQEARIYVQDKLREQAVEIRAWISRGAAIYVCGSLHGMAGDVDLTLREILGKQELDSLREAGLYRRDVY
jgi:sulfite reductase (NADPH) flavoprotein alpha-component